ncbi:MAG: heme biosynthesis HemY N-terminal domain-containing protein [Aeromonadaceae bacterium]
MLRMIVLLAVIAGAMVAGPLVAGHKGYVLIALGEYTIEMSVVSALLFALLLYFTLLLVEAALGRLFSLRGNTRNWFDSRRRNKARTQTLNGVLALAEGRYAQAENLMLKGARGSEQPLLNYLSAAEAAAAQGELERSAHYLQQAENEAAEARLAVGLIRARHLLRQGQYQSAETDLQALQEEYPHHLALLHLLKECYLALGRWSSLLTLLPQLLKHKQITAGEQEQLYRQIYPALFAERATQLGKQGLLSLWQELPKSLRQEPELLAALCRQLLRLDASSEGESLLLEGLRRQPHPLLLRLAGEWPHPSQPLLHQLEKSASKLEPALRFEIEGLLHLQRHDYPQAQKALELAAKQAPSQHLYLTLARVMEQQRLFEKANGYYRQAQMLTTQA